MVWLSMLKPSWDTEQVQPGITLLWIWYGKKPKQLWGAPCLQALFNFKPSPLVLAWASCSSAWTWKCIMLIQTPVLCLTRVLFHHCQLVWQPLIGQQSLDLLSVPFVSKDVAPANSAINLDSCLWGSHGSPLPNKQLSSPGFLWKPAT